MDAVISKEAAYANLGASFLVSSDKGLLDPVTTHAERAL